mgnify:CR=1 FL=1
MNKGVVSILIVIALVGGLAGGYYLGKQSSSESAKRDVRAILDLAFPPPPKEIKSVSGKIKNVQGSVIELEVDDPADYLPHADGSPRKKMTRRVTVGPATKLSAVDYSKFDKAGNPTVLNIAVTELRQGDAVTARADVNIRTTQSFTATKVELVRY